MYYKVIDHKVIHKGRSFSFCSDVIEYGGKEMVKDYVDYPHAVAVLPYFGRDEFVLVRQFRYAVRDYIYEIPAGKLEQGEKVLDGAIRELEEETGFRANYVKEIFNYYPAVGYSSEVIHIVFAKDLKETNKNLDEDEFTDVEIVTYSKIMDMIKKNEIKDAKTIISFILFDKFGGINEI